ncbi:hypothetical protein A3770_08p51640 [Chloropicon primus]|uniref:RWP-RK domain-containing protein n=1 Tax=Chloropicon primus TaxID=1764295 RepID=A0A5B8MQ87_9CHLO|nr:hypothetical protein A3770_08p51640 [Chloropicon primus]|eukprot:QDZ22646.1 hypothetical protein A3770_08p51640 [Chloropicon primus]
MKEKEGDLGSGLKAKTTIGKRMRRSKKDTRESISYECLRSLFKYPLERAAKELNVCGRTLRRRCVDFGIERWPYFRVASRKSVQESLAREAAGTCGKDTDTGTLVTLRKSAAGRKPSSSRRKSADEARTMALIKGQVEIVLPLVFGFENDLKKERSKRIEERKSVLLQTEVLCKKASCRQLMDEVEGLKECIYAPPEVADRLLEEKDMGKLILVLKELGSRIGGGASACLEEETAQAKHLATLSYHIGPALAKEVAKYHTTARSNLYNNSAVMSWWLAGLGYENLDKSEGILEGVKRLQDQIDQGSIQAMAIFGRLLKFEGLPPPVHHFKTVDLATETEERESLKEFLCKVQRMEAEGTGKVEEKRQKLEVMCSRKLAERVRNIRHRHAMDHLMDAAGKYRRMELKDLVEIFVSTSSNFDGAAGRANLNDLPTMDLRLIVKLVEEVKLRFMHLNGDLRGSNLFSTGNALYEHYVAVLTLSLGPRAAKALLSAHIDGDSNLYSNSYFMACWLVGLGYPSGNEKWDNMDMWVQSLSEKISKGELEPMSILAHYLEENDLPWILNRYAKRGE